MWRGPRLRGSCRDLADRSDRGAVILERANRNCESPKRAILIYARCWCKEPITF